MTDIHRCKGCDHLPHPGRRCRVQRVTGPASAAGHPVYTADPDTGKPLIIGYDHGGRTETQCECVHYTPQLNGVPHV